MNNHTLKILDKLYKEYSYLGQKLFIELVSEKNPKDSKYQPGTKKELLEWYRNKKSKDPGKQIVAKRDTRIKNYKIQAIPGSYQMDLVFFYLDIPWLMIIHVPSRYVWIWKLKNKTTSEVYKYLVNWFYQNQKKHTLENERFVGTLTSDQESAMMSKRIQDFCENHGIKYYIKDSTEHYPLLILDSAVRKIKDLFNYNLSNVEKNSNTNIEDLSEAEIISNIKLLDSLVLKSVFQYNSKPMRSLNGLMPAEANTDIDYQNYAYRRDSKHNAKIKQHNDKIVNLKVGDYVRVKERKTDKIQKARYYSDKVYRIIAKFQYSYQVGLIDDKTGEKIEISPISSYRFKPYELLKVAKSTKNSNRSIFLSHLKQNKQNIRTNILKDDTFHIQKKLNQSVKPPSKSSLSVRSKRLIKSTKSKDFVYF